MKNLSPSTKKKLKLAAIEIISIAILCNMDRFLPKTLPNPLPIVVHVIKILLIGMIFLTYYIFTKHESDDRN